MSDHRTPEHSSTLPPTFTRAVLQRLGLDPCADALAQLIEEPGSDPSSQSLIAQHLQHCESCRALHAALRLCQTGLPSLSVRQAPAGFLERSLQQTTGRSAPPARRKPSRLQNSLLRPRFALESAYFGSLLFILVFGLPVSYAIDLQRMELQLEKKIEQQMDQQVEHLQQLIQKSDIVRRENLSLLERTYQNSRERWDLLIQDTTLWLQQRRVTLLDRIKPDAETPPLPSQSPEPTPEPTGVSQ